jgi:hypothetical protein
MLGNDTPKNPTTGLIDLDRVLGGWPRGELSVIAGRRLFAAFIASTSWVW